MTEYDPLLLSRKISETVVEGDERKYYRFRKAKFYGGVATGDCVGCNLACHFCWSKKPRKQPEEVGRFYSPSEVKKKLVDIAEEHDFQQVRLSGNEPTIGREHLLSLLGEMEGSGFKFIVETNGILLGEDPGYVRELGNFENVHVRVSLKGCDPEQFSKLTGADKKGFELEIQALGYLHELGVSFHPAIIREFARDEKLLSLRRTLRGIDPSLPQELEFEKLILYPHVRKQLDRAGIKIPKT